MIVTGGNDKETIPELVLAKQFEMKALGRLKYFLGVEGASL